MVKKLNFHNPGSARPILSGQHGENNKGKAFPYHCPNFLYEMMDERYETREITFGTTKKGLFLESVSFFGKLVNVHLKR